MFSYEIRVPKDRVAVLIGKDGEVKDRLEETTGCTINIDSKEGDVTVSGEDAVNLYATQQIIKAVARGFNPDIALRLLKQDYAFEVINLNDYTKNRNHQQRLKGRVIGQEGKARNVLETLTESNVSVYGKTVCIIASAETIGLAKQAVEQLLDGANHSTVYKFLEQKRRDMKLSRVMGSITKKES